MWRATRRRARAGPARRGPARGLPRGLVAVERRERPAWRRAVSSAGKAGTGRTHRPPPPYDADDYLPDERQAADGDDAVVVLITGVSGSFRRGAPCRFSWVSSGLRVDFESLSARIPGGGRPLPPVWSSAVRVVASPGRSRRPLAGRAPSAHSSTAIDHHPRPLSSWVVGPILSHRCGMLRPVADDLQALRASLYRWADRLVYVIRRWSVCCERPGAVGRAEARGSE